ncbi:Cytochrome P450 [Melia azedarach]|uniref:Cytochrome P450 n=1 Tax=Melia azedarach TaxID=155640 RepID=A0ACC1YBS7_MELAZ|nr:Cytochrome P450 [Melia azedarach]
MESQVFSLLQSLQTPFCFIFFSITLSFSLFSIILYLRRHRFWCSCEICSSYLTSSWSKEFNNLCDWYTHLLQNSPGQTIRIHVLDNIITANPDNVEYILKTKFDNYPKGKPFSMILGDLLGKGIFNVDGDLWMFQKKVASLELATISIRTYAFEIVTNEIKCRLLPLLSSLAKTELSTIVDLQEVFRRFSFDNICKFSFGLDPGYLESSLPISLFANSFDLATKLSAERAMTTLPLVWKIKRFFNIGSERKLREAIDVVNVLAMEVIMQKRKLDFSTNQDLLSKFMNCINDDNHLRDIIISFILAGRDTMASAFSTFFFLLAHHPEVVSKIREESSQVAEGLNQEFASYNQIREMHYLHAAVYESLRLFPPVQFDSKFAQEDDILADGTYVTKGTRVTYHPYAMGRMEKIWGRDCMEFKPERWLRNGTFCPKCQYKYPVFQAGSRICLGKELALVEMKMVALSVLSKFEIEVVEPRGTPRFENGLTAMLRGGLQVVVKERS